MRRIPLAIFLLALLSVGGQQLGQSLTTTPARAVEFEAVIWQFGQDYPGADNDDTKLPVQTVYIKTHDATNWMSTYDRTGNAVDGPSSIRRLIADYNAQDIEVVAWFVPKGGDVDRQVEMAVEVIDSGVKGLYADLEPFEGFCHNDCGFLAEHFWWRVRAERPNAKLGVIYDPRPWTFEQSATWRWLAVADVAAPMCYWEDFNDQPPYNHPAGCVNQARSDLAYLAQGKNLEYIPMLQGNTTAERFTEAVEAARSGGAYKVSVWRRGIVSPEVWAAARALNAPSPLQPPPDYGKFWVWSPCPWDGCMLQEEHGSGVYVIYGGAKFAIPSPEVMQALGFGLTRWFVGDGQMASVPDVPYDGTLVRELGSDGGVWVMYGGARFAITSPDVLQALGVGGQRIHVLPPGGLNQIPTVPRDGTQLRELNGGVLWQITGGAKFALPNEGVRDELVRMGQLNAGIVVVPDGGTAQIPTVPREKTRIKEMTPATEWQVAAGTRFALPDSDTIEEMVRAGFLHRPLAIVPDGVLAQVPQTPAEGARILEFGTSQEWQIAGGMKFPIVDETRRDALLADGKISPDIALVPPGGLSAVASGFQDGVLLREPQGGAVFVWRCGSPYYVTDPAHLERLKAEGLAREPVLTIGGPLVEPPPQERPLCEGEGGAVCPKVGWGIGDPFAPAGCRPE
jgi:hypothetical protein